MNTPRLAIGLLVLAAANTPVLAQATDPPDDVAVEVGPLSLAPTIRVMNLGRDGNVFNDAENPTSDFTATFSPSVDLWLRLPRARVSGHGEMDYVHFNKLDQLRAVDVETSGRVDLLFNRVTPYVIGGVTSTRHRRNFEIDALARQRNEAATVGVAVRLTEKTSIDLRATRNRTDYEDALYLGTSLSERLNRTGSAEGVTVRYALTPLTTLALDVERERDRFEFATERDSDSLRVGPAVEFRPLALISGRASVGYRTRRFLDPAVPEFKGTGVRLDLAYTLLGRTRFGVVAERDLAYSYRVSDQDYITAGVTASVTHRLSTSWDLRGSIGRSRLTYRTPGLESDSEAIVVVAGELGYRLGRTRLGFHVNQYDRQSQAAASRDYSRLSISSSVTYEF